MENKNNWRDDKATKKQISFLKKYGKEAKTKGEAHDMIKKIIENKPTVIEYETDMDEYEYDYNYDN